MFVKSTASVFLSLLLLFLVFPAITPAQGPGRVSGTVTDGTTAAPLEYAVVKLKSKADSTLSGGITNDKGYFEITRLAAGTWYLDVSFVGYKPFRDTLEISVASPEKKYAAIQLRDAVAEEVVITEEAGMIDNGIDKRVYKVGKDISSSGSSAADVLQNVPSVTVDMDRNIQFRGNGNVNILINGRPSTLTGAGGLDQLPAAMIDRIEVISNPSAKYDPDGTAGIINIITRNAGTKGLSGSFSATAGTGDKYTSGFYINYRTKKLSLYSNLSAQSNRFRQWGTNNRENFTDDTTFYTDNANHGFSLSQNYSASLGADVDLNTHNSFGGNAMYTDNARDNYSTVLYDFSGEDHVLVSNRSRVIDQLELRQTLDASAYFRHTFDQPGHTLMLDVAYTGNASNENLDALQKYTFGIILPDYYQNTLSKNTRNVLTPQLNYSRPLKGSRKFEAGLKSILRDIDNDFSSRHSGDETNWVQDTSITNHLVYNDKVLSAYVVYSGIKGKFGYNLGLRGEKTFYTVDQRTSLQRFDNSYFNLFPTAHLKYQVKEKTELGFSYSRRINRPSMENLNPFPDWRDPYNLQAGNPYLRPEYTHSMELAMKTTGKKLSLNLTAYYRLTDSSITRYRVVSPEGISVTTFDNISRQWQLGSEAVLQYEPAKWVNMNLNLNGYYQVSDAGNLQPSLSNQGMGGSMRYMANLKFWKTASAQVIYNYNLRFIMPQGRGGPGQWLDLAIKKDFLSDNRLSLSLRFTDVFNTRQFSLDVAGDNFTATSTRKRESRIGYLGLSYRFGNGKQQQPKKPAGDEPPPDTGM